MIFPDAASMSVTTVDNINAAVVLSPVGTWFRLEGSRYPKERAGSRFLVGYGNVCALECIITLLRPKFVLVS